MCLQKRVFIRLLQSNQRLQLHSANQIKDKGLENDHSIEWAKAKPFNEIPGPTKFELIRGFLPGGAFYKKSLNEFITLSRKTYGDIVMLPGIFGKRSLLLSFNPDDFATVFRSEGIWPQRNYFACLNYHRTVYRAHLFGDVVGLPGSNGETWGKLRSIVNPILMQPRNARLYLSKMLEVNNEFLLRIREIRDPISLEMPDSFADEINRLTLESVAVVALNQQIGLIRKDRNSEEAIMLFDSIRSILELTVELDIKPSIWRIVKTPKFYKTMRHCDIMYNIIMNYINRAIKQIENNTSETNGNEEKSVLEKLLKIDKNIAIVMAFDMLMIGVESTASSLVGILLCIAKNPEKQEKLRQEIRLILPQKDSQLTMENMKDLSYLRACIKEGMRIYPMVPGSMRCNAEDIVMSGYQVPKGQDVRTNSNMLLMEEKYYPQAKEFIPERWIREGNDDQPPMSPFVYIPFGFGPRSCAGRRLAEIELEVTVARLVSNFYIEFNYSTENAFKNRLINVPAIPLNFKFCEVEN